MVTGGAQRGTATTTWEGSSTNLAWHGFSPMLSVPRDWRATVPRAAGRGRERSEIHARRAPARRPVDPRD
jgi:hypothetical protein